MMINLLGGSYESKFKDFNSQRTINWFPVVTSQQESDTSQTALFPTPGLTLYCTLPGRYIRGIFTARTHQATRCFVVCDNTLYEVTGHQSFLTWGSLSPISIGQSKVYME